MPEAAARTSPQAYVGQRAVRLHHRGHRSNSEARPLRASWHRPRRRPTLRTRARGTHEEKSTLSEHGAAGFVLLLSCQNSKVN